VVLDVAGSNPVTHPTQSSRSQAPPATVGRGLFHGDVLPDGMRTLPVPVTPSTATGFPLSQGTNLASHLRARRPAARTRDQITAVPSGAASAAPMTATATPVHVIHCARCSGLTAMAGQYRLCGHPVCGVPAHRAGTVRP
jgi:hypothetical protein